MTSPKYVIFKSDPALVKCSGDNGGYIYNPSGLFYHGDTFNVLPGEPVIIIPHRPADGGPWKQCRTIFEDERFLRCKEEETLIIMIENRFPNEIFQVSNGCSLAEILGKWGINHELSFVSDRQLEKIEAYEQITTREYIINNNNNNNNDAKNTLNIKTLKKKCSCAHK